MYEISERRDILFPAQNEKHDKNKKNSKLINMKKNLKFTLLTLGLVAGGMLSSCSNEGEPTLSNDVNSVLVKAPRMTAYSGDHYWNNGGTRGFDVNGNLWYQSWDTPTNVAEDLTAEDIENIKALLSKGTETHNEIILPWENYWVQQVYKGQAPVEAYNSHDRCERADCDHVNHDSSIVGSNHMDLLYAYNDILENDWDIWGREQFNGGMYEHVNNFNNADNQTAYTEDGNSPKNPGKTYVGTTLMTGMPTEGMTPDNQFGFHETFGTQPKLYNNYLIVEYKGYYYVGFDYEAHKNDQTTHNHGEGMDIERDWNFTDWIVRISPAYPAGTNSDNPGGVTPGEVTPQPDPTPADKCPKCDHPTHGDVCQDCNPDDPCYKDNDQPADTPDDNGKDLHTDEVEINLHADNKNGEYLESHLSIHVRAATDVEVFIPVPAMYYCDADDMAVVEKHVEELMKHGGPIQTVYNIAGNEVTLNVAFVEGGIRVWTDGINEEVIAYCREKYDDGITFEVWNYFNDPEKLGGSLPITLSELKYYLNKATVKFLDKEPEYYINAFMDEYNESEFAGDCHVTIVDSQENDFNGPETGKHLNGSDKNEIFTNKNAGA